ncbi:MAG: 2-C-methyl-D-erythritol 2,4-cyclodiphosphate synthase [Phycisphaerae bacterium]|nr:2-C-methyl-D-erythritol 2,4-cyclodiphosphate synthase [Phycisphaerae bacterium]
MEEPPKPDYRVGLGTDIHALAPDRPLMLGGIHIPFPAGLRGHSDGDVVLHAVIDALLGAAGLGDIGTLFPDKDPVYKNADSKGLLLDVKERLEKKRWDIVNVDVTIHLEQPRLEPFKGQIKRAIAGLLSMDFASVNVKAKTNEGLDAVGRGEAISATAVALLRIKHKRGL